MKMKSTSEITDWLKKQRLYDRFTANFDRSPHSMKLSAFFRKFPSKEIISLAFVWHDTKEGNKYWNRVNEKYLKWHEEQGDKVQGQTPH